MKLLIDERDKQMDFEKSLVEIEVQTQNSYQVGTHKNIDKYMCIVL